MLRCLLDIRLDEDHDDDGVAVVAAAAVVGVRRCARNDDRDGRDERRGSANCRRCNACSSTVAVAVARRCCRSGDVLGRNSSTPHGKRRRNVGEFFCGVYAALAMFVVTNLDPSSSLEVLHGGVDAMTTTTTTRNRRRKPSSTNDESVRNQSVRKKMRRNVTGNLIPINEWYR